MERGRLAGRSGCQSLRARLVILLVAPLALAACGQLSRPSLPTYPATANRHPGLVLISQLNGQLVRTLTTDRNAQFPTATDAAAYYSSGLVGPLTCRDDIVRQSTQVGQRPVPVLRGLPTVTALAVAANGRWLALGITGGGCGGNGSNSLVIYRSLKRVAMIPVSAPIEGLSWDTKPRELLVAVSLPGLSSIAEIPFPQLLRHGVRLSDMRKLPCAVARNCSESAPAVTANGTIYYISIISPGSKPCAISVCTSQRYTLTRFLGGRAEQLYTRSGEAGRSAYCAAMPSTGNVVVTFAGHSYFLAAHHLRKLRLLLTN